jgi:hypothetical protein
VDMWEVAKKLYAAGYSHPEVRRIWAYAWNEQHVGRAGNKRPPWEALALEEVEVRPDEVEFPPGTNLSGGVSNYF